MRTHRGLGLPCVLAHPLLGAAETPRLAPPLPEGPVLVLRRAGRAVLLGGAGGGGRCGLELVDDLLRLQVALGRFGWELHLDRVPPEVAELLELVGLPGITSRPGGR